MAHESISDEGMYRVSSAHSSFSNSRKKEFIQRIPAQLPSVFFIVPAKLDGMEQVEAKYSEKSPVSFVSQGNASYLLLFVKSCFAKWAWH